MKENYTKKNASIELEQFPFEENDLNENDRLTCCPLQ